MAKNCVVFMKWSQEYKGIILLSLLLCKVEFSVLTNTAYLTPHSNQFYLCPRWLHHWHRLAALAKLCLKTADSLLFWLDRQCWLRRCCHGWYFSPIYTSRQACVGLQQISCTALLWQLFVFCFEDELGHSLSHTTKKPSR